MKTKCFIFIILCFFLLNFSNSFTKNTKARNYLDLAEKCYVHKDFISSAEYFKKAAIAFKQVGENPPVSLYHQYIEVLFEKLKKSDIALKVSNEALLIYNDDPDLYRLKAYALGDLKKFTECFQNYDKAILLQKKSGKTVPYYWYTGAGYTAIKVQPEKALQYFFEVYNGNYSAKQKESPILQIAHLYYKLKKYNEFLTFTNMYINIGSKEENKRGLHDLLANYYYPRGELEKALNHARKVGNDFWITKYLRPRNVTLSFKLRFKDIIQKYHRRLINKKDFLIEAPLDTYYQKLVSVKSNPPFKRIVKKERMNWLEYNFPDKLPDFLEITCVVHIKIIAKSPLNVAQYNDSNDEIGYYAHERRRRHELDYDLDNPVLINAVNDITKGKATLYEKIKVLNGWLDDNVLHHETITKLIKEGKISANINPNIYKNFKKLSEVYTNRVGDCVNRPGLYAGMCRILKVPARILLGFVYHQYWKNPEGNLDGAHGINEIYDPVYKDWIQIDLMNADMEWINHHYSIPCGYYTREDKPKNYLNLMFLNQDAIKLGDSTACKWQFSYSD